jgi:hypothetical protein
VSSDVLTELLREAAMLGGLRHPNIVWVYGIVLPSGVREVKAKRERCGCYGARGGRERQAARRGP